MRSLTRTVDTMREWVHAREYPARPRRVKVQMAVHVELSPDNVVKGLVDDLSSDGFRLRCAALLHHGQRFKMRLARETVACELRWVRGLRSGGVFLELPDVPR